jgi:hypothetical protein
MSWANADTFQASQSEQSIKSSLTFDNFVDPTYTMTVDDRNVFAIKVQVTGATVFLPPSIKMAPGTRVNIINSDGSCGALNPIKIVGTSSDTVNGLSEVTTLLAYAVVSLITDGVARWTIASSL